MHALARLIEDVRAAHGWNQAEVGRRAGLSRSRVAQLINDPVRAVPTRDTIVSLARGLGVPPWVVMDAVLESVGLPTRPTHMSIADAVAADPDLSTGDKRAVLAFVQHVRTHPAAEQPDADRPHQGLRVADTNPLRAVTNGDQAT